MLTIAGGRCNIFLIYNGEKERKGNYTGSGEVWISRKKPYLWENIRFYLTLCQVFDINKNDVF